MLHGSWLDMLSPAPASCGPGPTLPPQSVHAPLHLIHPIIRHIRTRHASIAPLEGRLARRGRTRGSGGGGGATASPGYSFSGVIEKLVDPSSESFTGAYK